MSAIINDASEATLAYLAVSKDYQDENWRLASRSEFLSNYFYDDLVGIEGNSLSHSDEIQCTDGVVTGSEILE